MKSYKHLKIFIFLLSLLQCFILSSCTSGKILSETTDDTALSMRVSNYTGNFEREVTIKNAQSGYFSVAFDSYDGDINITITDGQDDIILTMNESATLKTQPAITNVRNGNGTYKVTTKLKDYTGSFDISWVVE